jgi:hypothetical protein
MMIIYWQEQNQQKKKQVLKDNAKQTRYGKIKPESGT